METWFTIPVLQVDTRQLRNPSCFGSLSESIRYCHSEDVIFTMFSVMACWVLAEGPRRVLPSENISWWTVTHEVLVFYFQMSMNLQMTQSQSMSLSSGIVNPHHHMHHMTPSEYLTTAWTSLECLGLINASFISDNSHLHQFSNSSGFTNTSNNSFVNSQGGPTSSGTQTTISSSSNGNNMNTSSGNNGGTGNGNNNHNNNNNHNHNNSSNGCGNNSNNNPNDFGFEFLDSLPGDPSFSAQDLLSSLDSTSNFNINDIL